MKAILINGSPRKNGNSNLVAERFAAQNGLHFRPADLIFAEYSPDVPPESTRMTLVFNRNGSVTVKEAVSSPGTSASNTLGGTFTHSLNKDFYKNETAETIAGRFGKGLGGEILRDGRLAAFIEKAKTHDYYKGKV